MTTPAVHPGRLSLYWAATRPRYLPTSAVPALAGVVLAIGVTGADWLLGALAVVAVVLVHCGVNVTNDVEDFARGVDTAEKMDNSRVFTTGSLSVAEGRWLAWGYFAAGASIGVVIAAAQGPAVLVVGTLGVLGGWLYTGGPRPYKYVGLGDPLIVLLMGPMITQGAFTAVTGDPFDPAAVAIGFVPGLLIAAVLQANNLSDIAEDAAAGVRTLAVRLGFGSARMLFLVSLSAAYLVVALLWTLPGLGPWPLIALATTPLAWQRARQALRGSAPADPGLRTLAPLTAMLHLQTTALLVAGIAIDRALGA